MIDFVTLGEYSIFKVKHEDRELYYLYSHITDSAIGYGYSFGNEHDVIQAHTDIINDVDIFDLQQIFEINDDNSITFLNFNNYDNDDDNDITSCESNIIITKIMESKKEPVRYVGFRYEFLDRVLESGCDIYYDYMDQGFKPADDEQKQLIKNEDGDSTLFYGEGLWINEKDYNKICMSSQRDSKGTHE